MADELTIDSGGVPIAVCEHGGTGTPLLLLHGGGGNLLNWQGFAPLLTGAFRVVSVDLRGHGRSGDGPWSLAATLGDLDVVTAELGLRQPVVAGHSLGGMLAGMWARRHPDCPAAVSLDGHRAAATHPECYAGLPEERVAADLAALREMFTAHAEMLAQPLTPETFELLLHAQRGYGLDEQQLRCAAERGTTVRNGQTWLRPDARTVAAMRDSPEFLDVLPVFAEVRAPLLVVLATRDLAEVPPRFADLMAALRAGLRRDLAAIGNEWIEVRELDASHAMVFERPEEVAKLIIEFAGRRLSN